MEQECCLVTSSAPDWSEFALTLQMACTTHPHGAFHSQLTVHQDIIGVHPKMDRRLGSCDTHCWHINRWWVQDHQPPEEIRSLWYPLQLRPRFLLLRNLWSASSTCLATVQFNSMFYYQTPQNTYKLHVRNINAMKRYIHISEHTKLSKHPMPTQRTKRKHMATGQVHSPEEVVVTCHLSDSQYSLTAVASCSDMSPQWQPVLPHCSCKLQWHVTSVTASTPSLQLQVAVTCHLSDSQYSLTAVASCSDMSPQWQPVLPHCSCKLH